jgi:hypothetical protein
MTDGFDSECDRLFRVVDPDGAARLEWSRTDGAALEKVAGFAMKAFEKRDDLNLVPQNTNDERRRFALTTRGGPTPIDIVTIWIKAESGSVAIWAEPLPDGNFKPLHGGRPYVAAAAEATEQWVKSTLQQIMSSINRR